MLSIYDNETLDAALAQPLDPALAQLLRDRCSDAVALALEDLTHILVVQPGDSEEAIEEAIGFTPLANPMDGARYGSSDFIPFWPWLQDLGAFHEMILPVGDSSHAYILIIDIAPGVLPDLTRMCAEFSTPA